MTQHERFARWYAAHREEYNAKRRANPRKRKPLTDEQRAKRNKRRRERYAENKAHFKEVADAWKAQYPDAQEYYEKVSRDRKAECLETDQEYYAKLRKSARNYQKRKADKTRKRKFVERPAGRIPDYMTKADVRREVRRSVFVENNVSDEAMTANRAYSRQLYRERWGIED